MNLIENMKFGKARVSIGNSSLSGGDELRREMV